MHVLGVALHESFTVIGDVVANNSLDHIVYAPSPRNSGLKIVFEFEFRIVT